MHGARLDEIYPVIPIAEEQTLSIGMLPTRDTCTSASTPIPTACPTPTRLAELIDDELRTLRRPRARRVRAAAARRRARRRGPLGTYENRSAVLSAAGRGGAA